MGTGITSILLHNLPYNARPVRYISYGIFGLNVVLFITFLGISLTRYIAYPKIWTAMIKHPTQSLFLGTFPMGLATIVSMTAYACVPAWGGQWWRVAWGLWWIDSAISVACCFALPFILMAYQDQSVDSMTAAWLLPIVSTIVASSTGAIVADVIPAAHPNLALITVIVSYILWATGVPLAMMVLTIYFLRLTTVSLPPKAVIPSTFLPLGPLGQGGFGIMQLGRVLLKSQVNILPAVAKAEELIYVLGYMMGLIMWGFGLIWLGLAVATLLTRRRIPFNMGWWGFTFPLGVFASSTTTLAAETPSAAFRVLAMIFSLSVVALWLLVAVRTAIHLLSGDLLVAPCLKQVEREEEEAARRKHIVESSC
jgi:C4-dicarboxylate transporter/malic acid transport protein